MRDLTAFRIHIQKQVQLFNILRIRHKVKNTIFRSNDSLKNVTPSIRVKT